MSSKRHLDTTWCKRQWRLHRLSPSKSRGKCNNNLSSNCSSYSTATHRCSKTTPLESCKHRKKIMAQRSVTVGRASLSSSTVPSRMRCKAKVALEPQLLQLQKPKKRIRKTPTPRIPPTATRSQTETGTTRTKMKMVN